MKLLPVTEFDLGLWVDAYEAAFNPEMAQRMGWNYVELGETPPSFTEFYDEMVNRIASGDMYAWGILNSDEKLVGYMNLTRTPEVPEWEIGTAVSDVSARNRGYGTRAHRQVLTFAFEELGAEWVWAISEVKSPVVERMMERAGYKRFAHFYLMHKDWFLARWGSGRRE